MTAVSSKTDVRLKMMLEIQRLSELARILISQQPVTPEELLGWSKDYDSTINRLNELKIEAFKSFGRF